MSTVALPYSYQALSLTECPIASAILSSHCHIHIAVSVSPEPSISWYRDDEQIEETERYRVSREALGTCHLDISSLEIIDQVITEGRYTNRPWGAGAWLTDPVYDMNCRVRGHTGSHACRAHHSLTG
jgi:hypothetical protein